MSNLSERYPVIHDQLVLAGSDIPNKVEAMPTILKALMVAVVTANITLDQKREFILDVMAEVCKPFMDNMPVDERATFVAFVADRKSVV